MKTIIENYYQYFNEKNYQAMLDLLSEDVIHDINQGHSEQGKQAFEKFLNIMDHHYDENLQDIVIMGEQQNYAAEFVCHGIYKISAEGLPTAKNQKYKVKVGAFFEVKNNKITRITNYYNLQEWIKQVS